jgi:hypothetical protein
MECGPPPPNKDSNGIGASSSEACSIQFLIEINKDYKRMWAPSSKAFSIEFLIEINTDSNGMWASSSKESIMIIMRCGPERCKTAAPESFKVINIPLHQRFNVSKSQIGLQLRQFCNLRISKL